MIIKAKDIAQAIGKQDYLNGNSRTPYHSRKLMKLMKPFKEVGQVINGVTSVDLMSAWMRGWDIENLKN